MRGKLTVMAVCAAVVFGLTVRANEKPTTEYQDIMKSNAAANGPMGLRGRG